jgi:hypothetical protein
MRSLLCLLGGLLVSWQAGAVGSWKPLVNTLGTGINGGHMLLLSDATVMVQNGTTPQWFRLTPDTNGGYVNGTWSNMAPMSYSRYLYASVVLQDGRVFIAGGEHPDNGPQKTNSEIYDPDPKINHWTPTANAGVTFSDSESVVLPDGTVIVHPFLATNEHQLVMHYYPTLDLWTFGATNTGRQGETTWVKLPDDSILTVNDNAQTSERYIPALDKWIKDASVPVNLFSNAETGPAFLLPDRRAFFLGASGHTALYTPSGTTNMGKWAAGPDIPDSRYADDAPGAMMVNGNILCAAGASAPNGGSPPPMWFYEYDYSIGTTGAFFSASSPTNSTPGSSFYAASTALNLLDLPDGTVLLASNVDPSGQLYVYQLDTPPLASGKPTIYSVSWNADGSLHLSGTLFNGTTQGASFGDDAQQDSNYPLVRFTAGGGRVYYGRTYNWSSTGVQTGGKIVTTECTVPVGAGNYSLQVVANGNASDPVTFYQPVWVDFNYHGSPQGGTYVNPFESMAQGVSAVSSGATIAFKANVQPSVSHETMTISKPMTLISVGGPATVGQNP